MFGFCAFSQSLGAEYGTLLSELGFIFSDQYLSTSNTCVTQPPFVSEPVHYSTQVFSASTVLFVPSDPYKYYPLLNLSIGLQIGLSNFF